VSERLRHDGVVITYFATVFGETALFYEAASEVQRPYEARPRDDAAAEAGSKGTFLTKFGDPSYDLDHLFARIVLHPHARDRERLPEPPLDAARARRSAHPADRGPPRSLPSSGTETATSRRREDVRLLHRTAATGGLLMYAKDASVLPERDEQARSNDEQLREVVPESERVLCEGPSGTAVVFADTCGYRNS
jgi:hypothetical protein